MDSFILSLQSSWGQILHSWNLWYPLLMLAFFAVLAFILSYLRCNSSKKTDDFTWTDKRKSISYRILDSFYLSGFFTLLVGLTTTICLVKFSSFFYYKPCQFGVMMGFFIVGLLTVLAHQAACKRIKKKEMVVMDVPLSKNAMNNRKTNLRKYNGLNVYIFLILALPFALLWMPNRQSQFVSIVLDNSVSMDRFLEFGTNSLQSVLYKTPSNGKYLLTTFTDQNIPHSELLAPNQNTNAYFEAIVNTTPAEVYKLPAQTESCESPTTLINAFEQVNIVLTSPLYQAIWQNYLIARQEAGSGTDFQSRKMIVITDGEDISYLAANEQKFRHPHSDIFKAEGKIGQSPYDFFDGEIYGIDLSTEEGFDFWNDCAESFQDVFDGTEQQSYFEALKSALPEMYFDWSLIYCLAILLSLFFLCIWFSHLAIK